MNIENLKQARETAHFTQMQAAKALGISDGTYKNYEQGKREPNNALLLKIADLYGVTTDYLLGREPAPPNPFEKLGLNEAGEQSMIEKYMSFPPEVRAVLMDALVKLAESTEPEEPERRPTQMTAVKSVDLYADYADSDEDSVQTA